MSVMDMEPPVPKKKKSVSFGHEEFMTLRGPNSSDAFLSRGRPQIETGGLIAPDTRLHPDYARRDAAFMARRTASPDSEDSEQEEEEEVSGPDEAEVEAAHEEEARAAQAAATASTAAAGLPSYSRDTRKYVAEVMNARREQGGGVESFDDLFAGIDAKEQSRAPEPEPEGPGRDPASFTLNSRPGVPTDPGAARFHLRNLQVAHRHVVGPGERARYGWGLKPMFLKATPSRPMYGSGENAEQHPTSYYPSSAWAVPPPTTTESGQIEPPAPGRTPPSPRPTLPTRSNRVRGQYFSTFRERMGAGAGFFGALFGYGMKRANERRTAQAHAEHDQRVAEHEQRIQAERAPALQALAAARARAPRPYMRPGMLSQHVLEKKVGKLQRSPFRTPDTQEQYDWIKEDMGYRVANHVGRVVKEASPEEEDDDDA